MMRNTRKNSNINLSLKEITGILSPIPSKSKSRSSSLLKSPVTTEDNSLNTSNLIIEPYDQIKMLMNDLPIDKLKDLMILLKKKIKNNDDGIEKEPKEEESSVEVAKSHYSKNALAKYIGNIEEIRKKPGVIEAKEVEGKVLAKYKWDKRKVFTKKSEVFKIENCEIVEVEPMKKKSKSYKCKIDMTGVIQSCSTRGNLVDNWWTCLNEEAQTLVCRNLDDFCASILADVNSHSHVGVNEDVISQAVSTGIKKVNPVILGTNYLMTERILGKDLSFKVDFFFVKGCVLHVFEYKLRNDRGEEEKNAYKCLRYKRYTERLINFLRLNRPDSLLNVSFVTEYGLAFSMNKISMMSKTKSIMELSLTDYQSNEFLRAMKRNKKRFKSK